MTHICVGKLTITDSENGLSPGRCQAIIWTNAGILLIGPLGTNFKEILIGIQTFSFKKMHLKMSSAKWRPFCLVLNVLNMEVWQSEANLGIHIILLKLPLYIRLLICAYVVVWIVMPTDVWHQLVGATNNKNQNRSKTVCCFGTVRDQENCN